METVTRRGTLNIAGARKSVSTIFATNCSVKRWKQCVNFARQKETSV